MQVAAPTSGITHWSVLHFDGSINEDKKIKICQTEIKWHLGNMIISELLAA